MGAALWIHKRRSLERLSLEHWTACAATVAALVAFVAMAGNGWPRLAMAGNRTRAGHCHGWPRTPGSRLKCGAGNGNGWPWLATGHGRAAGHGSQRLATGYGRTGARLATNEPRAALRGRGAGIVAGKRFGAVARSKPAATGLRLYGHGNARGWHCARLAMIGH